MKCMMRIANLTVKLSKRLSIEKRYLWMLITTLYLLSEKLCIFATRLCKLLIFKLDYFRGGEVRTDKQR